MNEFLEKYSLDNIPISSPIKEGAKNGNAIDILHIQLRAMGMLEFGVSEAADRTIKKMDSIADKIDCLTQEVKILKRNQKNHAARIRKLEEKVEDIEKQIA